MVRYYPPYPCTQAHHFFWVCIASVLMMRPFTSAGWTRAVAALISCSLLWTARSRQDDAAVTRDTRESRCDLWLSHALVSQRAAHGFAIHRHLSECLFLFVRRLRGWARCRTVPLHVRVTQHACYHRDDRLAHHSAPTPNSRWNSWESASASSIGCAARLVSL